MKVNCIIIGIKVCSDLSAVKLSQNILKKALEKAIKKKGSKNSSWTSLTLYNIT